MQLEAGNVYLGHLLDASNFFCVPTLVSLRLISSQGKQLAVKHKFHILVCGQHLGSEREFLVCG